MEIHMQGLALKSIANIVILLSVIFSCSTVFAVSTRAITTPAGCMGCHQGESMSMPEKKISHQRSKSQLYSMQKTSKSKQSTHSSS